MSIPSRGDGPCLSTAVALGSLRSSVYRVCEDDVEIMKAAWYERQGAARDVLRVGTMDEARPLAGEVRIHTAFSGVNPGDVKKRQDAFSMGMPYPRVIPHSDGSGTVDAVGE